MENYISIGYAIVLALTGLAMLICNLRLRKLQKNFIEQKRRWQELAQNIPDNICITDLSGKVQYVNRIEPGYRKKDILGKNVYTLVANEHLEIAQRSFDYVVQTGVPTCYRTYSHNVFGEKTWWSVRLAPLKSDEKVTGVVFVSTNVSAQLELEKQKQSLQDSLESAEKLRSLGIMTGGFVHDFNNLLHAMDGFADLLESSIKENKSEKTLVYLSRLRLSLARGQDVVHQMLCYFRNKKSEEITSNLANTIIDTIKILTPNLKENVSCEYYTELSKYLNLKIPAIKVQQILMNLIMNANDALKSGGTIVVKTYWTRTSDDPCCACTAKISGHYLCLEVCDTGQGIDPKIIDKIFYPQFSTKNTSRTERSGFGLGLNVVNKYCHEFDGHILVESDVNSGTKFNVLIPESSVEKIESEVHNLGVNDLDAFMDPLPSKGFKLNKVVVVEDDEDLLDVLSEQMKKLASEVLQFRLPENFWHYFSQESQRPDIILIDYNLPGLNGVDLAKRILSQFPNQHIILCSGRILNLNGYFDDNSKERIRFLAKPFSFQMLKQTINQLVVDGSGAMDSIKLTNEFQVLPSQTTQ